MKSTPQTFLIISIIFGAVAVGLGLIKTMNAHASAEMPTYYFQTHIDAAIYACGLISSASIVTAGLVTIKQNKE
jgi:hypothetical protein